MRLPFLSISMVFLLAGSFLHASPMMAPHDVKVFSPNHRFFAVSSVRQKHTAVFRTDQPAKSLWEIPVYSSLPSLADDGQHLALAYEGGNILGHDVHPTDPLITFYTATGAKHILTVSDVAGDFHRLVESSDGWVWGSVRGFDRTGWLLVDLTGGKMLRLDPNEPQRQAHLSAH